METLASLSDLTDEGLEISTRCVKAKTAHEFETNTASNTVAPTNASADIVGTWHLGRNWAR